MEDPPVYTGGGALTLHARYPDPVKLARRGRYMRMVEDDNTDKCFRNQLF